MQWAIVLRMFRDILVTFIVKISVPGRLLKSIRKKGNSAIHLDLKCFRIIMH